MATSKSKSTPIDKNQLVVDQLVALLESGVKPWVRPWKSNGQAFQNLVSRNSYTGMNPLFCIISNLTHGYESPYFLTFNQARQYGWKVKEGSKSCWIRFAKSGSVEVEDDNQDTNSEVTTKSFYYQKWSSVFNLDCMDDSNSDTKIEDIVGLPEPIEDNPDRPIPEIEDFIAAIGSSVQYGKDRAAYSPSADSIIMPDFKQFKNAASFYATLLHEHTHWTGHKSRLNREGVADCSGFNSKSYAREELIAEIGSAMLVEQMYPNYSGIELEGHAAYISSWLSALKSEPEAFFSALTQSQKACKLLIDLGTRNVTDSQIETKVESKELQLV